MKVLLENVLSQRVPDGQVLALTHWMDIFELNTSPMTHRKQRARPFVLALFLVAAHMGYGQYLHQKPINRALGPIHIVLGCEGDIIESLI